MDGINFLYQPIPYNEEKSSAESSLGSLARLPNEVILAIFRHLGLEACKAARLASRPLNFFIHERFVKKGAFYLNQKSLPFFSSNIPFAKLKVAKDLESAGLDKLQKLPSNDHVKTISITDHSMHRSDMFDPGLLLELFPNLEQIHAAKNERERNLLNLQFDMHRYWILTNAKNRMIMHQERAFFCHLGKVKELIFFPEKGDFRFEERPQLKRDPSFIIAALKIFPSFFNEIDEELKDNRDLALQAIEVNKLTFQYFSLRFRNNKKLALAAISHRFKMNLTEFAPSFQYFSQELKEDRTFCQKVFVANPFTFAYATEEMKNDKEVTLAAITALKFLYKRTDLKEILQRFNITIGADLQTDIEFLQKIVKIDPTAIELAAPELQKDPRLLAVNRHYYKALIWLGEKWSQVVQKIKNVCIGLFRRFAIN